MDWNEIAAWLFKAGGAAIGLYVANEFRRISETLVRMERLFNDLRVNFAVIDEKVDGHQKRIEKLEDKD